MGISRGARVSPRRGARPAAGRLIRTSQGGGCDSEAESKAHLTRGSKENPTQWGSGQPHLLPLELLLLLFKTAVFSAVIDFH